MSDVKRYDCTSGGAKYCQGCYTMSETELGDYVSAEDYDALLAERDALKDAARDVLFAEHVRPSCQEDVSDRCRCWSCSRQRLSELSQGERQ